MKRSGLETFLALAAEGLTTSQAAKRLGISHAAISQRAKRYGVKFANGHTLRRRDVVLADQMASEGVPGAVIANVCGFRSADSVAVTRWRYRNNQKAQAHAAFARAVKSGRIARQPCEICGNPKGEGHHPDYSKPLDVQWLCKKHHQDLHNKLRWQQKQAEAA